MGASQVIEIQTGTWLIFGIVFVPVYAVLVGWAVGQPRSGRAVGLGVGYLVGLTVALWVGLYLLTVVIDLVFF